jgi:periplasmic protein TonB
VNAIVRDASFGRSQAVSLLIHVGVITLLFAAGSSRPAREATRKGAALFAPVLLSPLTGGGGGGDRSSLPPRQGRLPKASLKQYTPPAAVSNNSNPRLVEEPTIIAAEGVALPNVDAPQFGDPRALPGPPSNGGGWGGGIGTGCCGGVGPGEGRGYGPGRGDGPGGEGVYRAGTGGVTMPKVVYKLEPEFSDDARRAKHQGVVRLMAVVGVDGLAREIRVTGSLGMGLDEKAMDAVRQWRFLPGTKNGKPVAVMAAIEVSFRLL